MSDTPCECKAWDAKRNNHTEEQHTDCAGMLCGGCDTCLSMQVAYYERKRNE